MTDIDNVEIRFTVADCGTVFDGAMGWRNTYRLIDWAAGVGFPMDDDDIAAVDAYRLDSDSMDVADHVNDLHDAAWMWIQNRCAPDVILVGGDGVSLVTYCRSEDFEPYLGCRCGTCERSEYTVTAYDTHHESLDITAATSYRERLVIHPQGAMVIHEDGSIIVDGYLRAMDLATHTLSGVRRDGHPYADHSRPVRVAYVVIIGPDAYAWDQVQVLVTPWGRHVGVQAPAGRQIVTNPT